MILKCSAGHKTDTESLWVTDKQFGDKCGQLISYDVMGGSLYCQRRLKEVLKDFWDFWQISGRYGKWSKYHFFLSDTKTVSGNYKTICGIWPEPDNYQKPSPSKYKKEILKSNKCKRCLRILNGISDKDNSLL